MHVFHLKLILALNLNYGSSASNACYNDECSRCEAMKSSMAISYGIFHFSVAKIGFAMENCHGFMQKCKAICHLKLP